MINRTKTIINITEKLNKIVAAALNYLTNYLKAKPSSEIRKTWQAKFNSTFYRSQIYLFTIFYISI